MARSRRHDWYIKDKQIFYTCPDMKGLELEDEIEPQVICMVCDEEVASGDALSFAVDMSMIEGQTDEVALLREGLRCPVGINPERYKKWNEE